MVRLGNQVADGGYVVPLWIVESTDVLLTLGMGREWTFDEDVVRIRPGVSIVGVDHSVHAASFRSLLHRSQLKQAVFRFLGHTSKATKYAARVDVARLYQRLFTAPNVHIEKAVASHSSTSTVTIDELFTVVRSDRPHRVLFAMDIEGGEYDVVDDILRYHSAINMIVTEFHYIGQRLDEFERSITKIKRSFDIVHLHGNNCGPYNHEFDIPEVVEITFVHRSLMPPDSQHSADQRPLPGLDVPNKPGSPDYVLHI
jgi:hypothetical protein